jgi:hypothetical protein
MRAFVAAILYALGAWLLRKILPMKCALFRYKSKPTKRFSSSQSASEDETLSPPPRGFYRQSNSAPPPKLLLAFRKARRSSRDGPFRF